MIEEYLASQMKKAHYELIDDGTRFYAEIEGIQGVWAVGKTLEECREELFSTLEGWFILSLQKSLPIPGFSSSGTKKMQPVHA